jgi:hypothetical protein
MPHLIDPAALSPPPCDAGGLPREASPLMDHVNALVRTLESQRSDRSRGGIVARLAKVAVQLGNQEGAQRLAMAFGFKL